MMREVVGVESVINLTNLNARHGGPCRLEPRLRRRKQYHVDGVDVLDRPGFRGLADEAMPRLPQTTRPGLKSTDQAPGEQRRPRGASGIAVVALDDVETSTRPWSVSSSARRVTISMVAVTRCVSSAAPRRSLAALVLPTPVLSPGRRRARAL